jgi:uncharacterized Zn finger protein
MGLTYDNFEQVLDTEILKRGRTYYKNGQVTDLTPDEDGWTAIVVGSDEYEVDIHPDDDGDLEAYCTCPYEYGPLCKHVAAVLYAIRAETKGNQTGAKASKSTQDYQKKLNDILGALTREQLLDILLKQVKKDKSFGNDILLQYSPEPPDKAAYTQLIKDAIRAARGHGGYIEYTDARRLAAKIQKLVDKAQGLIQQKQSPKAIPILQAVIETVPAAYEASDDSDGGIMGTVEQAIELLSDGKGDYSAEDRRALIDYALGKVSNAAYGWSDIPDSFLWLAGELVTNDAERKQLFKKLDSYSGGLTYGGYIADYRREAIVRIKREVMERLGDPPEAIRALLMDNINLNAVRQDVVKQYIQQGRLVEARELCEVAIELYQRRAELPGLVQQYRELLLQIAVQSHDAAQVSELSKMLFFDTSDMAYFEMLKRNTPEAEWPAVFQQVVTAVEKRQVRAWDTDGLLADIYSRENKWREVLRLARKPQPAILNKFHVTLEEQFPDEMAKLYEQMVYSTVEATNREAYQQACNYIRRLYEMEEAERAEEIVQTLMAKYPRRHALLDELRKL